MPGAVQSVVGTRVSKQSFLLKSKPKNVTLLDWIVVWSLEIKHLNASSFKVIVVGSIEAPTDWPNVEIDCVVGARTSASFSRDLYHEFAEMRFIRNTLLFF